MRIEEIDLKYIHPETKAKLAKGEVLYLKNIYGGPVEQKKIEEIKGDFVLIQTPEGEVIYPKEMVNKARVTFESQQVCIYIAYPYYRGGRIRAMDAAIPISNTTDITKEQLLRLKDRVCAAQEVGPGGSESKLESSTPAAPSSPTPAAPVSASHPGAAPHVLYSSGETVFSIAWGGVRDDTPIREYGREVDAYAERRPDGGYQWVRSTPLPRLIPGLLGHSVSSSEPSSRSATTPAPASAPSSTTIATGVSGSTSSVSTASEVPDVPTPKGPGC